MSNNELLVIVRLARDTIESIGRDVHAIRQLLDTTIWPLGDAVLTCAEDDLHGARQRRRVTPPYVDLQSLRSAVGWTLDQVCDAVNCVDANIGLTRGGLSAIEGGLRGVSAQTLRALEQAYGLNDGAITTTYEPRQRAATRQVVTS